MNGQQFDDIFTQSDDSEKVENTAGLADLFKNSNIRKNTISVLVIWLVKTVGTVEITIFDSPV